MLVIRSVISEDLNPSMSGCNNSIPRLIKKQKSTVFKNFPFPNFVSGNRNPKGMVIITFNTTCRIKSPLPAVTSINGTIFIKSYGWSKMKGREVITGISVKNSTKER